MKILVITDLYPILENEKFTPRTIKYFVDEWKKNGNEIKIIKPNFLLNLFLRKKPFYKSGIYENIENINYFSPFLGDIKKKIKHNFIPDITVAHMPSGLIFANKLGQPFIAAVHVSDLEVLTNPIYSIYFKREIEKAYKNASKIAARSEILKKKFLELYPQYETKTFVAYSGIDSKYIIKREWNPQKRPIILTCANLIKRKNIDKLILACENLDIELKIIGTGKEFNKLKSISPKPQFLGFLPNNQVIEEMRKADIFVLPSQNETFGMVYLEAMASGCVTVGLKNDGIDGIIKDGENGYLLELNDIENQLKTIIQNDNSQILENSYNTILNYTRENAAKNYLDNIFN